MDEGLRRAAATGGGLVLREGARRFGVTESALRWAVRTGELVRVGPGGFAPAEVWERQDARGRHLLAVRAALARHPDAVAAAESAAVVWGLPLPGDPPAVPVLMRPRSHDRPEHGRRGAVTMRRAWLSRDERTTVQDVRTTTAERAFVDVSRALALPWSLAVADAVRRRSGCSVEDLVLAVDRHPEARGHALARRAAVASVAAAESPLESLARGVQLRLGLPTPAVQVWIGDRRPEYRVDMLVEEHATVVEADGRGKYEGATAAPGQAWEDKRRTDRLLDLGYDMCRFVFADERRPEAWGRGLLRVFARSARRRGLPEPRLSFPWA